MYATNYEYQVAKVILIFDTLVYVGPKKLSGWLKFPSLPSDEDVLGKPTMINCSN